MSMAYLNQILPISSTMEAVEITHRAGMWSWFAKNITYQRIACMFTVCEKLASRVSTLVQIGGG